MAGEQEDKLAKQLETEWTPESERQEAEQDDESSKDESPEIDPKEMEKIQQEAQAFQQLASDEQINKLIQSRTKGEQVEVISKAELDQLRQGKQDDGQTEDQDVSNNGNNDDRDIEELSNAELMKRTQQETLNAVKGMLQEQLQPVQEKLGQVDSIEQERQKEKVSQQVEKARQKYSDFDDHKKKIMELSQQHQTLDVDSLYWLAKKESGALDTLNEPSDQEKPTGGGAASNPRDRGQTTRQTKRNPGNSRKGFQSLLEEALS